MTRSAKRILRHEMDVSLLEISVAGKSPKAPRTITYLVSSRRTPKLHCFDSLPLAASCFDEEIRRCRKPHLAVFRPASMSTVAEDRSERSAACLS